MSKYLSSMALASLALATIATHAANTVPLPDSEQFTPIPQMEIGKVKRVSRNQLPQELKDYTAQEIATSKRGFEDVPEEYFVYLSNYTNRVRLDGDVRPNTKVSLADIGKTALAKLWCWEAHHHPTVPG